MKETWTTRFEAVHTNRGDRYVGVCVVGEGYPSMVPGVPRGAQVRYRSPMRTTINAAVEQARQRTIHHNLWHDGSAWANSKQARETHARYSCPER